MAFAGEASTSNANVAAVENEANRDDDGIFSPVSKLEVINIKVHF